MKQELSQPPAPHLNGAGLKIGIVVARFNWHITGAMLYEARRTLQHLGVADEDVAVYYAPGSFELPLLAQTLLQNETYDAVLCIGCVMKGATRHDVIVGDASGQGIQQVSLTTGIPVIFGVICAETQQQAEERIVRGVECAEAAVEMARTIQNLKQRKEQACLQGSLKK
ncbi:6,7-dimethyl-8-ribityllumazine synthase [Reticulibacter mediterranei]|uniref:6,7-dimethyl-8-ribityllumazine synthase n=1 Tax=Reticulibacter mediterranei TaxID=2778369 RepID=A0A8J3N5X7_9CHLR|nr:6,7-dimethyl-8-ribityllumazine synthase [Reticulibacter mediterranei]GHO96953.1 6,7-dimethyl-8-ribityllumazine synthase [Reticulibacter mediterranei]